MPKALDFDQSPALAEPMRFFLTAPLFGLLAGALVLWQGSGLFDSRWTPAALALTHLITAGFMLQVMVGAMIQLLPVVVGAHLAHTKLVIPAVHIGLTVGALTLAGAFLTANPVLFIAAATLLVSSVGVFIGSVTWALRGVGRRQPTPAGMKLALFGLVVTVALGVVLALINARVVEWLGPALTPLHVGWGLLGWGGVLLTAVAYVVVPMFQMTHHYPDRFARLSLPVTMAVLMAWTVSTAMGWSNTAALLQAVSAMAAAVLAAVTLLTLRRSKRSQMDPTQVTWHIAMVCLLTASALWMAALVSQEFANWMQWPLLWGVLVLWGGFVSVMVGMLYKIVPFLVWLHLRQLGQGKVHAPNMKLILPERAMWIQVALHSTALLLLMAAAVWPYLFATAAGLALLASNAALLRNLLLALMVYRNHLRVIAATPIRPPRPPND